MALGGLLDADGGRWTLAMILNRTLDAGCWTSDACQRKLQWHKMLAATGDARLQRTLDAQKTLQRTSQLDVGYYHAIFLRALIGIPPEPQSIWSAGVHDESSTFMLGRVSSKSFWPA